MHFISIDKRVNKNNNIYIILENGQEIILPKTINAVPALLLLNQNHKVLFGNNILEHLKPTQDIERKQATNHNDEPSAFAINNAFSGVVSDNYSFLDQNTQDLSAKGEGGMRQLYSYATLNNNDKIYTPTDDYTPDKVSGDSLKNYENERNKI
tara:strand:- start:142 stop:600 length:459 start_codon:yes stop_codon:yes gene_type:complete